MATSNIVLNEKLRAKYLPLISEALASLGEEVLQTKNNEIAFPVVDSEGNEKFVTITVKVPTGDRSGEPYDGYGEAESYRMHIEKRAREKAETAAKNAAKAKRDAEYRAKQKANREKANKEKAISKG